MDLFKLAGNDITNPQKSLILYTTLIHNYPNVLKYLSLYGNS